MKYIIGLLFFFASLPTLYGCTGTNRASTVLVQDKENSLKIKRFDKDLHDLLQNPSTPKEEALKTQYKDFLSAFGTVTIDNPDYNNDQYFPTLVNYFSNPMLSQIYKDALSAFATVDAYETELNAADELIKQQMEGKQLPALYMHVSGFKANTIVMQNSISISIDKYLGKDYSQYKEFFEEYLRIQMESKMIVRDYLKAWLMSELPTTSKRKDLLSEMIDQGKILYALQQLLPEWSETDLIGYTPEQTDWAKNKEKDIWKMTVKQNYLYSTDYMTIVKYMDDAPYTSLISQESPGRLGAWIGWLIVKKYAENSKLGLDTILKQTDNQNILKTSKYNP